MKSPESVYLTLQCLRVLLDLYLLALQRLAMIILSTALGSILKFQGLKSVSTACLSCKISISLMISRATRQVVVRLNVFVLSGSSYVKEGPNFSVMRHIYVELKLPLLGYLQFTRPLMENLDILAFLARSQLNEAQQVYANSAPVS